MSTLVDAFAAGSWIGHDWLALAVIALTLTALIAGFMRLKPVVNHVRNGNSFYERRCRALARRHHLDTGDMQRLQSAVRRQRKIF